VLHTRADGPATIAILQFYFPGWKAKIAETGDALNIEPSQPDGLLQLEVPPGDHDIIAELTTTPAESTGGIISAVSLVILGLACVVVAGLSFRYRKLTA